MNQITCDLLGPGDGTENAGLGNQMFQIAAITSLAHDNGAEAVFPQILEPKYGGYQDNIFHKVPTKIVNPVGIWHKSGQSHFAYEEPIYLNHTIYSGYYQSEKYFKHNRKLILDLFTLKLADLSWVSVQNPACSIHIRRGDYLKLQDHHPTQPLSYYQEAMRYVLAKHQVSHFLVFSDDIEWCKEKLPQTDKFLPLIFVENEPDYVDLLLMSMCDHNIIANSSFSWWGAWLNQNPEKIVVAPKKWFGPAKQLDTKDLLPEEWIQI